MKRLLPQWLLRYRRADLGPDVSAGLTTAVLLVPQAMAYAMLAGLPPVHGLYASIAPLVLYALSGQSRTLAVGPVALIALLTGAAVADMAEPGSSAFIEYTIVLAGMVGVVQLLMAALRLGYLLNFLSHPVVLGFTAAAAILIGTSQVPALLGWQGVGGSPGAVLGALLAGTPVVPGSLLLGVASLAALLLLRRVAPSLPGPLLVVAGAALAVWVLGSTPATGIAVVGAVPSSLPVPSLQVPDFDTLKALLPAALAIALVGFLESVAVARAFHKREHGPLRGDRELVGLGLANVAAALFRGMPVAGGFSRTAVNARAGARTQMAALVSAAFVVLSIVLLGPLLAHVPKPALSALILMAVASLIDRKAMHHVWEIDRADFTLMGLTFVATLVIGVEEGILIGALASLIWFVGRTTRPHYAVLGKLPEHGAWRNVRNYPEAQQPANALMLRFDARLWYANTSFLLERIATERGECAPPLRALILDMAGINLLDSSGAEALIELARSLEEEGIVLGLAQLKRPCQNLLEAAGFFDHVPSERAFLTLDDALAWLAREELSVGFRTPTADAAAC